MKKDVFAAIFVGFLLGAGVAIIFINFADFLKKGKDLSKVILSNVTPTALPLETTSVPQLLEIINPSDESLSNRETIDIIGKTSSRGLVLAISREDSVVKVASDDGTFSMPIKLAEGGNAIVITSYNDKGQEATKTLTLFYTTESL